ncbi:MAG: serine/threonine protein kinase [Deltaproteobacteria bacterium]|nr:serine/threonine protein kinase [Deltaproteobacteria bacterium]
MTSPKDDPLVGTTIDGRYRVLGRVASGGMGVVYRAEQVFLKREVALKRLHRFLTGQGNAMARFQREAQAAVKISHPNVCQVLDCGVDAEGALFIAMELLDGQSLGQRIADYAPLPLDELVDIGAQICDGLERAHAMGIVHRDLKPDNVMLVPREDGAGVVAKIMDFGVAKIRDDAEAKALTQAGMVFGTPKYMAPEQASGEPVDARADLYSLGVILFEMATGRPPFDAPTMGAMLTQHLTVPAPTLESAAPELEYPPAFRDVVARCLAKDPGLRIAPADALARELRACAELHIRRVGPPRPRLPRDDVRTAFISGTSPLPPADDDSGDVETRHVATGTPRAAEAPTCPGTPSPPSRGPVARWLAVGAAGVGLVALAVALTIRGRDTSGPTGEEPRPDAAAPPAAASDAPAPAKVAARVALEAVAPAPPEAAGASGAPDAATPSREDLVRAAADERRAFTARPEVLAALALDAAGKTREAIAALESLASSLDGEAHYHFVLAGLLDRDGRLLDALQHALRALALDPRYVGDTELHSLAERGMLEPSTVATAMLFLEQAVDAALAERLVAFVLEHTRSVSTPSRVRELLAARGLLDGVPDRLRLPLLVITTEDCEARRALLAEIAARPDAGMKPHLERFRAETGCGPKRQRDCWPCERRALREALAAVDGAGVVGGGDSFEP